MDLWCGLDGLSLLERARRGETAARRELAVRWEMYHQAREAARLEPEEYMLLLRAWFADFHPANPDLQRMLRAIRRKKATSPPPAQLLPLLLAYVPASDPAVVFECLRVLSLGPRGSRKKVPPFPRELVGAQTRGRPPRLGLAPSVFTEARQVLALMIQSHRQDRVPDLTEAEVSTLLRCGMPLGPAGSSRLRLTPEGEARLGQTRLAFVLPWQTMLFWRAVGKPPPGVGVDVFPAAAHEFRRCCTRCDAAATWLLNHVLARAGRSWRPARLPRVLADGAGQQATQPTAIEKLELLTREIGFTAK